ncbi:hypothetical protein HPP92_016232 [Vanilla planifolia]|uniref:HTH myb-type domain-containing protein n=1 Tax=Vanilla planifolia TaxID=51239 RepID=A0A835UU06_VANPL|nr:hypothetical protein HPP92_016836 [Vanilla planifolia]KAG0471686.1 hypothetical protein HPP92_016232 [Vanilla planifolia]
MKIRGGDGGPSSSPRAVDSKPRLRWNQQLHERFVDAVAQLGGPEKATPKSVKQAMGVPGLTLYHLKSHLQKYRLAKNRDACAGHDEKSNARDDRARPPFEEAVLQQIHIDVQRKLHEQLEVQKHLQMRIEAHGKYLRSVLRKAHDTLAGLSSSSSGMDAAKAQLSEMASAVERNPLSAAFATHDAEFSLDSCLTYESFEIRERIEASSSSAGGEDGHETYLDDSQAGQNDVR